MNNSDENNELVNETENQEDNVSENEEEENQSKSEASNEENIKEDNQTKNKFQFANIIDLEFNSTFYSNRKLEVEQLKTLINKNSNHGLTGLKNLGNSSYINTIIQCLSQTLDLVYYFLSKQYVKEITKQVSKSISKIIK